jgi:hypothetical protein
MNQDRPDYTNENTLVIWTIFERPKDFPDGYVVRKFYVQPQSVTRLPNGCVQREFSQQPTAIKPDPSAFYCKTLQEAREAVPPGMARLDPMTGDDPTVKETWI